MNGIINISRGRCQQSLGILKDGASTINQLRKIVRNKRQCGNIVAQALDPQDVHHIATTLHHSITLMYEPIVLQCQQINCGDIAYRDTLDLLRRGGPVITTEVGIVLGLIFLYLLAPPGVLKGWVGVLLYGPLKRKFITAYSEEDVKLGKKIGEGGFGAAYVSTLTDTENKQRQIVVKRADEFGEAEVWMNERLLGSGPYVARYICAYQGDKTPQRGFLGFKMRKKSEDDRPPPVYLLWEYEGDSNLAQRMVKKDFPYSLEEDILGRSLMLEKGPARKIITIKEVMRQLFKALKQCHNCGIVHRDIKAQNIVVSVKEKLIKLVDFGGAADLLVGINYVPNEYLLDPRYAPPQQYIMQASTPRPPPPIISILFSPVLWRLQQPDRFDSWCAGIVMLQLVFAPLRSDNSIIKFNEQIADLEFDFDRWREVEEAKGNNEMLEGFEMLDLDNGSGWKLMKDLLSYEPSARPAASVALQNEWFLTRDSQFKDIGNQLTAASTAAMDAISLKTKETVDEAYAWGMIKPGMSEADLIALGFLDDEEVQRPPEIASNTVAWWKQRRAEFDVRRRRRMPAKTVYDDDRRKGAFSQLLQNQKKN